MNEGKKKYMVIGRGVPLENGHQSLKYGELHLEKAKYFKYMNTVITDYNNIRIV